MTEAADTLTLERLDELAKLEKAATKRSSRRWVSTTAARTDGTAQVYSPSRGPLRAIVPIAESLTEEAFFIAAMRNDLPDLLAAARCLLEIESAMIYLDKKAFACCNGLKPGAAEKECTGQEDETGCDDFSTDGLMAWARELGWTPPGEQR